MPDTTADPSDRTGDVTVSERIAAWTFGAYVAVAGPLLLFKLGSFFWFARDDWFFITDRRLDSPHDLFADFNGHWSTVPVIAFRVLYAVFGLRSYVPYQAVLVALHLGVATLLRVVMRRAGVGPWIATASAGALVLFGPGRDDILWAFQIGFTGAVFLGLSQLLLADHEGRRPWRDVAALCAGLLAIMSTAPGLVMVVVVGLVVLVRHGWRRAAGQTIPLGCVYLVWAAIVHPDPGSDVDRPDLPTVFGWLRSALVGTFSAIGHNPIVAWFLVVVLIAGLISVLVVPRGRGDGLGGNAFARLRLVAAPLGLLAGSIAFSLFTVQFRWPQGPQGARIGRYLYILVALTLPAIAVAADEIARRWRWTTPALALVLLVSLPSNVAAFNDRPFGPAYHQGTKDYLTTLVRMPIAREVQPDVRPISDPYITANLDVAFLLQATRSGKLRPSRGPIPPLLRSQINLLLGFNQTTGASFGRCERLDPSQPVTGRRGTRYLWESPGRFAVRRVIDGHPAGAWVVMDPSLGRVFTLQSDQFTVAWAPVGPGNDGALCRLG